jgi:hypothetical protein
VQEAQLYSIQAKIPFNEALYSVVALREFHVKEAITFTAGVFDITELTNSYGYWSSMIALHDGIYRQIELLTDHDLTLRRTNMLAKQLSDYPAATLFGNNLMVYPTDIATAEFFFLKNPTTPIYDYYLDEYQVQQYYDNTALSFLAQKDTTPNSTAICLSGTGATGYDTYSKIQIGQQIKCSNADELYYVTSKAIVSNIYYFLYLDLTTAPSGFFTYTLTNQHYVTTGQTGSDDTTSNYTIKRTEELEWGNLWHIEFCNEILSRVGINLKDEQVRQYVGEVEGQQK